ncbi:MAG: ABC transporter substrate-binding protein [Clostridia bacterium]|nr:ABC transporter substrate-binding protein [Clostridia bacterium]
MKTLVYKTIVFALLSALFLCVLLASCTEKSGDADGEYFTFSDALGREVTLTEAPMRVASLLGSFADVWCLAGGTLCAAPEDAWEDFGLELPEAVNLGGAHSPSLELLLSSDPDFVIASSTVASNVEMRETLEALGISVAYFDVKNFDDYLRMLDICTTITGRRDLYEANGTRLYEKIEAVKADFRASVPTEERKILLVRASASSIKAKGSSGTVLGEMLSDIGCENIADSDSLILENLGAEAIIRENPYHIFVVTMGADTEAAISSFYGMINENPAWSTLDAVRCGRVHIMDKTLFNLKPNARWAESYERLYEEFTKD